MKVAIVGGASSWVDAPFDDESWEIWVLGNQMDRYKDLRVSRIFEIHDNLEEHDASYPQWLVNHNIPLVVSDKFPMDCNHSEIFDYDQASKLIGENFSSSPAVMMAQAILDGAYEIAIFGVDMALDEHEYFMQRPSMEQWVGYAKGIGINVHIHRSSSLGYTTYREGRDWPNKGFDGFDAGEYRDMYNIHKQRFDELEQELNEALPKVERMKAEAQALSGAMQVYERLQKVARAKSSGIKVGIKNAKN